MSGHKSVIMANGYIKFVAILIIATFALIRFVNIQADFPKMYTDGGFIFTDEGWYCNAAIAKINTGKWTGKGFQSIPVIPVNHIIQYCTMSIFGISAATTRATVSVFFILFLLTMFLICRKMFDSKSAIIALVPIATSAYLMAYSRVALLEIEMMFFVSVAVLSAMHKKTAVAVFMTLIALLVKPTAMFCVVPIAYLFWENKKQAITYISLSVIIYAMYIFAVKSSYPEAFSLFFASNVSGRAKISVLRSIQNISTFDVSMFSLALMSILTVSKKSIFACLLILFSVAMIGMNGYQPNRYFAILVIPFALLIAEGASKFGNRNRFALTVIIVSVVFNLSAVVAVMSTNNTMERYCNSIRSMNDLGPLGATIDMFNGGKGLKPCFTARKIDLVSARKFKAISVKETFVYGQKIVLLEGGN